MKRLPNIFKKLVFAMCMLITISMYYMYGKPNGRRYVSDDYGSELSFELKVGLRNPSQLNERWRKGCLDRLFLRDLLPFTRYINLPKSPCEERVPELVILVQSACHHIRHREAIRETWGKRASSLGLPVLFFVGQCPNSKEERDKYNDVVEVNFKDSYYNNTIKSLSRLRWYLEFCPKAKYLFMSDDDTVIHVKYLIEYLRRDIGFSVVGPHYPVSHVYRQKGSKWYQPYFVYPYPSYPDYLGGWCYVVNGSAVKHLYEASLETTYFSIDDVLFTGVAANLAGITKLGDGRFPLRVNQDFKCGNTSIICSQGFSPDKIKSLWSTKIETCK